MVSEPLRTRLHANVMAVSGLHGEAPAGIVDRRDGELLYSASPGHPFLNGAFRVPAATGADVFVERGRRFFAGRGGGFLLYVHPDDGALGRAAESAGGVEVVARYPEMLCRAPLPALPGELQTVRSPQDAAAYWRVCDEAYPSLGVPPGTFTAALAPEMLLRDDVEACLALAGGEPVACASIWMAAGVGMVGWVGSLPSARGTGLAAAATVWATNRAFALGGEAAALQASPMGEPLYERLGYEHAYAYRVLSVAAA